MRTKLVTLSIAIIAVASISVQSCKKDSTSVKLPTLDSESVYVVCEGNFGSGDAALYLFHPSKDSVDVDVFNAVNHQPLGDVFQSMTRIGNNFFLCINNSDKVVVLNASTLLAVGSINIPKPRYILSVSDTKAYITSEYGNKVYIVNTQTLSVTGSIDMPFQNPEGIALYNNNAYISNWDTGSNRLYEVNTSIDKIVDSVMLTTYAPQEVLVDKENKIWVLSGDQYSGKTCALTRIDPATNKVISTLAFSPAVNPMRLVLNKTKDSLYFIEVDYAGGSSNNGVFRIGIHDVSIPSTAFIPAQTGQYFWGVGVDPVTGNIYIGDPKGFTQKGTVYVYKSDGTIVYNFNVGIGPGHFYFDEK